jgi:hypothetical protein
MMGVILAGQRRLFPCVAASLAPSLCMMPTSRPYASSLTAAPLRSPPSNALASSWLSPMASASRMWPSSTSAILPPSGDSVAATSSVACTSCSMTSPAVADPSGFPPLPRAQIVALACLEPIAEGLPITHWTSTDLARQAVADGIVQDISPTTVQRILAAVDLQLHCTRYWRTARLDSPFKQRAEHVLWCYANAADLAERGIWVVCADEMPNLQVLEREPIRRALPGSIEQQEFEYTRHGTVNRLLFLVVHTGRMDLAVLPTTNAAHDIAALQHFRRRHRHLKGVFLIHDGGASHTAGATVDYMQGCRAWWRPRLTPAHASWLDQAEMLVNAFKGRYLRRGSWVRREEFLAHVGASWPEYNQRYAHPFQWTWTNPQMRQWFARHAP